MSEGNYIPWLIHQIVSHQSYRNRVIGDPASSVKQKLRYIASNHNSNRDDLNPASKSQSV